jgi:hypothetical protein
MNEIAKTAEFATKYAELFGSYGALGVLRGSICSML